MPRCPHSVFAKALLTVAVVSTTMVASPVTSSAASNKDFILTPNTASLAIKEGNTVSLPFSIKRLSGFSAPVKFSVSNGFIGVSATTTKITKNSMTLVVKALPGVTFQRGNLVVTASGGGKSHSANITSTFGPAIASPTDPARSGDSAGDPATAATTQVAPGFGASVAVTSSSTAVRNGDALSFVVTIRRDGYVGGVRFAIGDAIPGVKFDLPYEVVEGSDASLFVTAGNTAKPGNYTIQLTVSTDTKTINVPIALTIA
jgi:hypothetical protein